MSDTSREITPEIVLAALERAERHREDPSRGVPIWSILDHLETRQRSAAARRVRANLEGLEAEGAVVGSRRRGRIVLMLSRMGAERLRLAQRTREVNLPESPQHRFWREAGEIAAREIDGVRSEISSTLREGLGLLGSEVGSDAWSELGQRLGEDCSRMSSAIYCLREWSEPDDVGPDTVSVDRRWRRNIRLWVDGRAG